MVSCETAIEFGQHIAADSNAVSHLTLCPCSLKPVCMVSQACCVAAGQSVNAINGCVLSATRFLFFFLNVIVYNLWPIQ